MCSEMGKGAMSEAGKGLFRAVNVWWSCAQYFLLTSGNRCIYMAHVCFYIRCSDCVGDCDNVCCVAGILKDSVFKALE